MNRPILRYFGSKHSSVKWLQGYFPMHDIYIDLFGGSAAVLLNKAKSPIEVYNDLDKNVVNFFEVVRTQSKELTYALEYTPYSRDEWNRAREFIQQAPLEVKERDKLEWARCFFVFLWQSHGGFMQANPGWRFQKAVSIRKTKGQNEADRDATEDFEAATSMIPVVAKRLKSVYIECSDYREIIKKYDTPTTLYYVDPPYIPDERHRKRAYFHEMNENDHVELLKVLKGVKGLVVLSGYDNPLYNDLLDGWHTDTKPATNLNGGRTVEKIWYSPSIPGRQLAFA